jgi:hypothetical protein
MSFDVRHGQPRGWTRWHSAAFLAAWMAMSGGLTWLAIERAIVPEPVTTGIAPASQSGKPLPIN